MKYAMQCDSKIDAVSQENGEVVVTLTKAEVCLICQALSYTAANSGRASKKAKNLAEAFESIPVW